MRYLYKVLEEEGYSDDFGTYSAYGIALYETSGERFVLLSKYHDVFTDKKSAHQFAKLCTEEELEPIHFKDAIEDALL